jgi:hypothetical protein
MNIQRAVFIAAFGAICFALGYWLGMPRSLNWAGTSDDLKKDVSGSLTWLDHSIDDIREQHLGGFRVLYPEIAESPRIILEGPKYRVVASEKYAFIRLPNHFSTGVADFDGNGRFEQLDVGLPNIDLKDRNFDGVFDFKVVGEKGFFFFQGNWYPTSVRNGLSGIVVNGAWRQIDWDSLSLVENGSNN